MIRLTIPIANEQELYAYQKGILGVLGKVEIPHCDDPLKEHIKSVYRLLDHLINDSYVSNHAEPQSQPVV